MNQVPTNARAWITRHLKELVSIQNLGNTHPINASLWLNELSQEYTERFDRDLVTDLAELYPSAS